MGSHFSFLAASCWIPDWGDKKAQVIRATAEWIYMLIYVSKYVKATGLLLTIEDPQEHQADDQHDTHDS